MNTDLNQSSESQSANENSLNENRIAFASSNIDHLESELNAIYSGVAVRDISHSGVIELRGNDVLDFLDRISTNSIKNIVKGEIGKTIFCTEKGKIIDTATVINLEEFQLVVCSQEHREKMMIWLNKYLISDDVKLSDINGKYTILEVLGPQADSFMMLINGNIINNIPLNGVKIINTDGIIFFLVKHMDQNDNLIYWVIADPMYAQKLIRYMIENKGAFDFQLIGEDAYNQFRIEQGIPIAPNEINDMHNPHEVGLMKLVNNSKGCYIGQEVILRLETFDKVQKHPSGFIFVEQVDEHDKFVLFDEFGNEAGSISSVSYSNKFKKQIGIGFIRQNFFEDGKALIARSSDKKDVNVNVKVLPFRK